MKETLNKLATTPGMIGCAVFDERSTCLAHAAPAHLEPILLTPVMSELESVFNLYASLEPSGKLNGFISRFDEGFLIVRWSDKLRLLGIAAPSANLSMVNVGMNVATLKLAALKPTDFPIAIQPAAPTGDSQRGKVSQSQHGLSLSGSHGSIGGTVAIPADAVGVSTINALIKLLAKDNGPMAKLQVKDELTRLGLAPQAVGVAQYDDLVNAVSKRVADPGRRRDFQVEAKALLNR